MIAVRGSSRSPERRALFWILSIAVALSVAIPSVLAGPRDLAQAPRLPSTSTANSATPSSGVKCTTLAPAFKTCAADVPFLASSGRLFLDLSGLVARGDVTVQLVRGGEEIPVWECSIPAGSAESCDAQLTADDGAEYRIVARVDDSSIGRWGWTWTPGFA